MKNMSEYKEDIIVACLIVAIRREEQEEFWTGLQCHEGGFLRVQNAERRNIAEGIQSA